MCIWIPMLLPAQQPHCEHSARDEPVERPSSEVHQGCGLLPIKLFHCISSFCRWFGRRDSNPHVTVTVSSVNKTQPIRPSGSSLPSLEPLAPPIYAVEPHNPLDSCLEEHCHAPQTGVGGQKTPLSTESGDVDRPSLAVAARSEHRSDLRVHAQLGKRGLMGRISVPVGRRSESPGHGNDRSDAIFVVRGRICRQNRPTDRTFVLRRDFRRVQDLLWLSVTTNVESVGGDDRVRNVLVGPRRVVFGLHGAYRGEY